MALNGPPVEEHLLARVRRWFRYYAGGPFWPFNHGIEPPDAERPPEEDRIIRNLPVPQDDIERNDGHQSVSGEAREEDLNHNANENGRAPSPPHQQFPPQHFGMDWRQRGPAVPDFPGPYPVLYAYPHPHAHPFAFPPAFPHDAPVFLHVAPAFHHAHPFAFPPAFPHNAPVFLHDAPAFPHDAPAFPHAAPAFPPAFPHNAPVFLHDAPAFPHDAPAFPHAAPAFLPAFPHGAPVFHHAHPFAFPQADPYAFPHAAPAFPRAFHHVEPPPVPQEDPDDVIEAAMALYLEEHEEDEDPEVDVVGLDDEDGIQVPEVPVENIGPVSVEDSFDELSFCSCDSSLDESPVSPSTSGLSSSTRRNREESDSEVAAAKKLRWSDDSDSD